MWSHIWSKEFGEFWPNHSKVWKFLSDGFFSSKYTRFELQKYIGVPFHDTEQWCKTSPYSFENCMTNWLNVHWRRISHRKYSMKKGVLKDFVKFAGKHLCQSLFSNFVKKEALAQVFSCEFCKISKNTFYTEHLWTTASVRALISLKNCTLMDSFCPKYRLQLKKFHRNFVSRHWRVMQHLKEDWLVAEKMS